MDGERQPQENSGRDQKSKVVQGQMERLQRKSTLLYNEEKNITNGEGEEVEMIPKEKKNSKSKKARIQQEEEEEGREEKKIKMMQEDNRGNGDANRKKKERKNATGST